jgi:hypothetical protein
VKREQAFENISLKEIGFPGLPATTEVFGYQDTRVSLTQSLYSAELDERYGAQKHAEQVSAFSTRDARDVVYAVGIHISRSSLAQQEWRLRGPNSPPHKSS